MKKNLLFGLLWVLVAWFWFGGISMAADYVASTWDDCTWVSPVGCYTSLQNAVDSAGDNDSLKLLQNVSLTSTVVINKNLKIDLNGHNILGNDARALWVKGWAVEITGNWTISVNKTESSSFEDSSSVIRVGDSNDNALNASLTIGKDVIVSTDYCYGITVFWKNSWNIALVLNGKVNVSGTAAGISWNGSAGRSTTDITIGNTAEVKATQTVAIYHPGLWTLMVYWNVEWLWGIEGKAGNIIIKDGATISSTTDDIQHVPCNNGPSSNGYAISIIKNNNYQWEPSASIEGWTISGFVKILDDHMGETDKSAEIAVSWWTFNKELDAEYIDGDNKDLITVDLEDPIASINNIEFSSLENAINAATGEDTVKLLSGVSLTGTIEITKDLTIDLNWHNITATDARALWIKNWNVIITGNWTISVNKTESSSFKDSSSVIRVGDSNDNALNASLTIGKDVIVSTDYCYGITVFWKNSWNIALVLNGKVNVSGTAAGISWNGSAGRSTTDITIGNTAEVKATQDTAIYHPENWILNISWWTIEGLNWVVARAWTIKIASGAVFNISWEWIRQVWDAVDPKISKWKTVVMDVAAAYPWASSTFSIENALGEIHLIVWTKESYQSYDVSIYNWEKPITLTLTKDWTSAKITKPEDPTKDGNAFSGWFNWEETIAYDFTTAVASNVNLNAKWNVKQYTITFNTDGWSAVAPITQDYWTTVTAPANPTKDWYTFAGWDKNIPATMPAENLIIKAKWNVKSSWSTWGWGGGSSYSTPKKEESKVTTWTTNTWSNNEEINLGWEVKDETTSNVTSSNSAEPTITDADIKTFWDEQIEAYKWAFKEWITTMDTVEKARLDQKLTRAELAKMMVVYIQKVKKITPLKTDDPKYSDVDSSLWDLADYIKLAYQYQIMGIDGSWNALNEFNPNGLVTRAEYATVFSRVLFWSKYNQSEWPYYEKHIAALKAAGILTNDDPTADEYRGWVMLMMYRSANTPLKATNETAKEEAKAEEATWAVAKIANPASTYCVEQGWEIEIKEDKDGGQYGVCKFKDGTEVEEWEYFRANHKDEASTWTVAESTTWAVAATWTVIEAATGATATTWATATAATTWATASTWERID